MKQIFRQVILPLIGAVIWGVSFVAQKVSTMGAFWFDASRSFVAVAFLLVLILFVTKGDWRHLLSERTRKETGTLWLGGLVCGTFLTFAMYCQQTGMNLGADAGKAGFLTALYVVLVPVFGVFLKKKTPVFTWIAVGIALFGLYFLSIKAGTVFAIEGADLILLTCAVLYACQILAVSFFATKCHPVKLSCLQFLVCAVTSLVLGVFFEPVTAEMFRENLWPILYLGMISSGIGYTIQIVAQNGTNEAIVSLFMSMESVFSVIAGAVFLSERMTGREYLGAGLMFVAVVLNIIGPLSERRKKAEA
ncbi:MAG: DMT family transporter [Lachnospiraceae bacterium]|nr:DMT family transporter [Lachnospiraceae bacterium]